MQPTPPDGADDPRTPATGRDGNGGNSDGGDLAAGPGRRGRRGRTGRRPGSTDTREQILVAAREAFLSSGYDGATIRGIAASATVDPALVHHYFGTKDGLFVEANQLPFNPAELVSQMLAADRSTVGERLIRTVLVILEDPRRRKPLIAMMGQAFRSEAAAAMLRQFITKAVVGRVVERLGSDRPDLRATLATSQLVGLVTARYVVRIEPLASASPDLVVAIIGPTIQRYVTGDLPS